MDTTPNGGTIDGRLDTRTKDVPESVAIVPTRSAGDPDCRTCGGAGVTRKREGVWLVATPCACASRRQLAEAIERCWPADVIKAARAKPAASVLTGRTTTSLWVRAERDVLAAHLAVALPATGRIELVRVASDADLATAWLARVGGKVRDEEVREALASRDDEDRYDRLVDLVAPPALLVIQLGVKAVALKDLPGLVTEAILTRQQRGRPTWIVDTAAKPLAPGHLAHSEELAAMLATWGQVRLGGAQEAGEKVDLAAGAAPKAAATVHPKIQELIDKHQVPRDAYEPQGDKRKGIRMDHHLCGGKKTVSGYYNESRDDCTGKCKGEGCPTGGSAKALVDFLPVEAKPTGKTIGAQALAQRLREILSDGTPRPRSEVKRQIGELSYSEETLKRGRKIAGVIASDATGTWTWQLPTSQQGRSTP